MTGPADAVGTVEARPRRLRRVAAASAAVVVVVFAVLAVALRQGSAGSRFGTADQVAMFGLGLVAAAAILTLGRPSLSADARGLRVRNVVGSHVVPWQVVRAVRFDEHTPWATLELEDDDTLAVMAVQAVDGERAVDTVAALRRLLAQHRGG